MQASRVDGADARPVFVHFPGLVPAVALPVPDGPAESLLDVDVVCGNNVLLDADTHNVLRYHLLRPAEDVIADPAERGLNRSVCHWEIRTTANCKVIWQLWDTDAQVGLRVLLEKLFHRDAVAAAHRPRCNAVVDETRRCNNDIVIRFFPVLQTNPGGSDSINGSVHEVCIGRLEGFKIAIGGGESAAPRLECRYDLFGQPRLILRSLCHNIRQSLAEIRLELLAGPLKDEVLEQPNASILKLFTVGEECFWVVLEVSLLLVGVFEILSVAVTSILGHVIERDPSGTSDVVRYRQCLFLESCEYLHT